MKRFIRENFARLMRVTPGFKGKGRIILALDRVLTDQCSPDSYLERTTLNNLGLFQLDLRPWGQKFAYYYGEWEKPYICKFRELYELKGGIFIDVGSSIGLYTCCLGSTVSKLGGKIYSIEPIPFNLDRQKKSVMLNPGLSALVEYFPVALGAVAGKLCLQADPLQADNNAYQSKHGNFEVAVTRLDDLMKERHWPKVGAIKLDIEGWEPDVIRGAEEMLRKDHPVILGEFHRGRMKLYGFDMAQVTDFLIGELGYTPFILSGNRFLKIIEIDEEENIFFIPEGVEITDAHVVKK